jgi:hypothetical protein
MPCGFSSTSSSSPHLFAAALLTKNLCGRWKWLAFGILRSFVIGFALFPGTLMAVLEALPGRLRLANTATLILGGVAAGFLATGV